MKQGKPKRLQLIFILFGAAILIVLYLNYSIEFNHQLPAEISIDEEKSYDVIQPWLHRFGEDTPWQSNNSKKIRKQKSKWLSKCNTREIKKLIHRDEMLSTNILVPSKDINFTALKHNFWDNVISQQHSQMNAPNTLKTVQYDNKLTVTVSTRYTNETQPKKRSLSDSKCSYNGRVFGIGMYKTGTTSLSLALSYLGYVDNYETSIYKWLKQFSCIYSHWFLILRHYYDFMNSVVNINDHQILSDVLLKSQRSFNFGDVPMLFFWPFFDRWYPNSKYILTKRTNTAKFVNSVMRFCIQLKECMHWKFEYDAAGDADLNDNNWTTLTLKEYKWNEHDLVDGVEIAHYIAMIYELHNERIIQYFTKNDQLDQLLIVNIDEYTDWKLWKVIMDFLGCSNEKILSIKYPHVNPTRDVFSKIKLIPDDYVLDWRKFFKNKIPIMMAEHKPHRRIWFEYQETQNGKYEPLL